MAMRAFAERGRKLKSVEQLQSHARQALSHGWSRSVPLAQIDTRLIDGAAQA